MDIGRNFPALFMVKDRISSLNLFAFNLFRSRQLGSAVFVKLHFHMSEKLQVLSHGKRRYFPPRKASFFKENIWFAHTFQGLLGQFRFSVLHAIEENNLYPLCILLAPPSISTQAKSYTAFEYLGCYWKHCILNQAASICIDEKTKYFCCQLKCVWYLRNVLT